MHNKQFIKITFHLAGQTGDSYALMSMYRVIGRLGARQIGEYSAQHIAELSEFCQELQFPTSCQHFYFLYAKPESTFCTRARPVKWY